jgi:hypothetical protein
MKTCDLIPNLIPSLSVTQKTLVRAFLVILWKEIFALPDTRETRSALDKIEDLMSTLDPEVTEVVLDIDLSKLSILVEELDSDEAALWLSLKKGPSS